MKKKASVNSSTTTTIAKVNFNAFRKKISAGQYIFFLKT